MVIMKKHNGWSYSPYQPPLMKTDIYICRVVPTTDSVSFDWLDIGAAQYDIYWKKADILTETYEGTATFCVYGQNNDNIRICDLKDGGLYRLPEGMIEDLGNGGIRLKNIPITDSPLAILFK